MKVVVRDYNILSHFLVRESQLVNCARENLKSNVRFEKIINKLQGCIDEKAIICLQEVPQVWGSLLFTYFYKQDYCFVPSYYGNVWNGRMGVAIAFPRSVYNLEESHITTIIDTKRWADPPEDKNLSGKTGVFAFCSKLIGRAFQWAKSIFVTAPAPPPVEQDIWSLAKSRHNTTICLKLSVIGAEQKQFFVSTYHMPCMFFNPPVMMIHSYLIARYIQKIARGTPYILAGDFNFKPTDMCYKFYTGKPIDRHSSDYPVPYPNDTDFDLSTLQPMKSAYKVRYGSEPYFTTHSGEEVPFQDTLDYIFHSPNLRVLDALPLPAKLSPIPNKYEPSDHLMIGATFQLD